MRCLKLELRAMNRRTLALIVSSGLNAVLVVILWTEPARIHEPLAIAVQINEVTFHESTRTLKSQERRTDSMPVKGSGIPIRMPVNDAIALRLIPSPTRANSAYNQLPDILSKLQHKTQFLSDEENTKAREILTAKSEEFRFLQEDYAGPLRKFGDWYLREVRIPENILRNFSTQLRKELSQVIPDQAMAVMYKTLLSATDNSAFTYAINPQDNRSRVFTGSTTNGQLEDGNFGDLLNEAKLGENLENLYLLSKGSSIDILNNGKFKHLFSTIQRE